VINLTKEEFVKAVMEHQNNKRTAKIKANREAIEIKKDSVRRAFKKKRVDR